MRLVVVSYYPQRWDIIAQHLASFDVARYPAVKGISTTYRHLKDTALLEGWDTETVVVQDDVRFPRGIPDPEGPLTVYGTGLKNHVCPRAFAASAEIWKLLPFDGKGKVCDRWKSTVDRWGVVLNVTAHPKVAKR